MDKAHILSEIKRTADENDGKPLGAGRFQNATGIRKSDWESKYWARWGDALSEAGYEPNPIQSAYDDAYLLEMLVSLIQELGSFPTVREFRIKAHSDETFPSYSVFARFVPGKGRKAELARKVFNYAQRKGGLADVVAICQPLCKATDPIDDHSEQWGYVYLIKSGRNYKIGKSSDPERRAGEVELLLPDKTTLVHKIKTDDPSGIEAYWHRRFAPKRKRGEWFSLASGDVAAFKRRKQFM